MKLTFTRHGESLANTLNIISNRDLPHPLTPKGREQAAALASRLRGRGITRVYTSPILRALETAEIVAKSLNQSVQIANALREYDCSILEGRGDAEAWELHERTIADWLAARRRDDCPEGGETFKDIRDRFVPFIESLVEDIGDSDEHLLLVTHGGILLLGLPHVLTNVSFDKARSLPFENTFLIEAEQTQRGLICRVWGERAL